jgi:hypothetical protein
LCISAMDNAVNIVDRQAWDLSAEV